METIRVRGARTHNLKNVNVDLPRNRLVVITGLSGSGKSSLAFDTLYAEGQRRYVESLSAYARQFLQLMEKPDVDLIEGLSPAIAIEQKASSHNPRSTVGTVTEIHDYLRLLFARAGTPYCPDHPEFALTAQTVAQMVDSALSLPADTRVLVLAPVVRERKGEFEELLDDLRVQGFVRFRIDGAVVEADALPRLAKQEKHSIDVVVDRLKIRPEGRQRLAESFETALRIAEGRALLLDTDNGTETVFSNRFACPICGYSIAELEPRLFSFNNPLGACPTCDGLGTVEFFDEGRVVVHPELSIAHGAIKGWDARNQYYFQMLASLAKYFHADLEQPWNELPDEFRTRVLHGTGEETLPFSYSNEKGRRIVRRHAFEGVLPNMERRWRETDSAAVREELAKYRNVQSCPSCGGTRLRREARFVFVGEGKERRAIYEIEGAPLRQIQAYFSELQLAGAKGEIGGRIVREIALRLRFLNDVGLTYLTLDRAADTLSGGEAQRIRLASQIGSGLTGVMYVLDEPSIGLHQRDNERLIATLRHLRDLGNTVLVVEHDEDAIRAGDYVVDMGPGAGEHGGHVVADGTPAQIEASPDSLTGAYLAGRRRIDVPVARVRPGMQSLRLLGSCGNNLKQVDLDLPVGLFVCVTGVSGSGKSTLINDTLAAAVSRHLYGSSTQPAPYASIEGCSLKPPRRANAATKPGASRSMSRAAVATPARATGLSRSRCISSPTSTCRAIPAMARATTARRSRCSTRARTSPRCSISRSSRHMNSSTPCRSSRASCKRCST